MKQTKHTPGPWTWRYEAIQDGTGERAKWTVISDKKEIARVGYGDTGENEANARLIAAAPETAAERDRLKEINKELLEACKYSLKRYEISDTEWARAVCAKCRAAIAKAEGG